jgi:hypothetical protein
VDLVIPLCCMRQTAWFVILAFVSMVLSLCICDQQRRHIS